MLNLIEPICSAVQKHTNQIMNLIIAGTMESGKMEENQEEWQTA